MDVNPGDNINKSAPGRGAKQHRSEWACSPIGLFKTQGCSWGRHRKPTRRGSPSLRQLQALILLSHPTCRGIFYFFLLRRRKLRLRRAFWLTQGHPASKDKTCIWIQSVSKAVSPLPDLKDALSFLCSASASQQVQTGGFCDIPISVGIR